jgi:hypothetical protein
MPEKYDALERLAAVARRREFRDSLFTIGTSQSVFASGPLEGVSLEHARDGESDVGTPPVELGRAYNLQQGQDDVLRDVLGRQRRIVAGDLAGGRMQHRDECEK